MHRLLYSLYVQDYATQFGEVGSVLDVRILSGFLVSPCFTAFPQQLQQLGAIDSWCGISAHAEMLVMQ